MGMFDTVKIEYPLTDHLKLNERLKRIEFQTKHLHQQLDNYTIDADGQLWHQRVFEGEPIGKLSRCNYTGVIEMLGSENSRHPHGTYEFAIEFADGKVVSVERIN